MRRSEWLPIGGVAMLALAAVLVFILLSNGSPSSLFGCAFGRDLLVRHDQGGNRRYYNDRGPDCSDLALLAQHALPAAVLVGAAVWLIRPRR